MNEPKIAVYTGTRNLYEHMIPAVKSLLINSDVEKVYLLIEDNEFPYELPDCVECINVSGQRFFRQDGPNMNSCYTYMAMMRAALCKIFPQYNRILSLDVDTIVDKDISDLWDLPLGHKENAYYFAAAREPHRCKDGFLYTNIGVALYNLEFLRDRKGQEVIDILNTRKYTWLEQDAMNARCQKHILIMSSDYNDCCVTERPNARKIVHFAAQKEWFDEPLYLKYKDIPWSEIRKKPESENKEDTYLKFYLGESYRAASRKKKEQEKNSRQKQDSIREDENKSS